MVNPIRRYLWTPFAKWRRWDERKRWVKPNDTDSLRTHITWYTNNGYVVESQTETSAVLVKPKGNFSWGWYIFWSIASFPAGIIFYPIYRFIKSDRVADLGLVGGEVYGTRR